MRNEKEIRQLMQTGMEAEGSRSRALKVVSRARRQVGQKDTIGFALVRIWATLARLLAPFFAFLGERQARASYRQETARPSAPGTDSGNKGED